MQAICMGIWKNKNVSKLTEMRIINVDLEKDAEGGVDREENE